ncbi:MAG: ABC-2 type transport system ATP-binding protein [Lentisphaeria bacterium]|jgi:ABC-2 type transport system ATP-binding protein
MRDLAVDVHGLVKRFGDKVAVNGLDIQLSKGQVWGFLGEMVLAKPPPFA